MSTIFIGLSDVASFIDDWKFGFEANSCKVLTGSKFLQSPFQTSTIDFTIEKAKRKVGHFKPGRISTIVKPWWDKTVEKYYFKKVLRKCDTFFFMWHSFNSDFSDFKILKAHNKKIVTVLVGDDVRWFYAMKQEYLESGLKPIEFEDYDYSLAGLEEKLLFLRNVEKYSDFIFTQPCALQLALRPYHNLFIPIIPQKFTHKPEQNSVPLIIHAPTSLSKGTKYVDPVIERLKKEGVQFNYKCLKNLPRAEALKEYENADIIVDQLLIPGGGKLAYECLAMGKVVVTLMENQKYDQKKPADCPLVNANSENLYDVLKNLISDLEKRKEIASQGRPFIEKYHNPKIICKKILDTINIPIESQKTDFTPIFFRDKFIPESTESIPVYNKWTNYVMDCSWYKKNIKPGERAGLQF